MPAFHIVSKLIILIALTPFTAQAYTPEQIMSIIGQPNRAELYHAKELLDTPEDQIDFAHIKLTIDKIIDPSIDIFREKNRIVRMVSEIQSLGNPITSNQKKDALRKYLYQAGEWNNHQNFGYDFNDPLGKKIENKILSNYLDSRKGNCVSMPFLFIVLGQQLGLNVTASTAPLHVFVKYTDDVTGITQNLETTSGAKPARDVWLRQQFPMTDIAVQNGIYLRKLTKKQTVTVMFDTLLEHYSQQGRFGQTIVLAKLLLEYDPNHIAAVIHLSSAHNELLKQHGLWQYHAPYEVPPEKRAIFNYLVPRVNHYHIQAEKMGWQQLTTEQNEKYLENVKKDAVKITENGT